MLTTQLVLLVGGKGTRLGERSRGAPKPLLPVAGVPFVQHLIEEARRFGVRRVLLLAGHLGHIVEDMVARQPVPGVDIRVLVEPEQRGTGGALRFACDHLDETFLMANGDSYFGMNLLDLAMPPHDDRWLGKLALRRIADADRYGVVDVDHGRIIGFRERGEGGPGVINGGVYLLRRDIIDAIGEGEVSLERQVFPVIASQGRLFGSIYSGDFLDIGIPDALDAAQTEIPRMRRRPAAFLDRDGVLNTDDPYVYRRDQFKWIDGAQEMVKRLNDAGYFTFVVTNQAGVAHGYYGEEDVHRLHDWLNGELAAVGAHIDAFYHCPFHPEGKVEAYRGHSEDRKPAPGMLLKARNEWPIEWQRSFLIGNKDSDIAAAIAAGVSGHLYKGGDLLEFIAPYIREPAIA